MLPYLTALFVLFWQ